MLPHIQSTFTDPSHRTEGSRLPRYPTPTLILRISPESLKWKTKRKTEKDEQEKQVMSGLHLQVNSK